MRAWDRVEDLPRVLNLLAYAVAIVQHHDGMVPPDVDERLALPGIGPWAARPVAAVAFEHRHPVIDNNVRRVIARAADETGTEKAARHPRSGISLRWRLFCLYQTRVHD